MNFFVKTYHLLFFIGLFLLPFNSEIPEFLSFLGEYSADSSPIFFLLAFAFFVISIFFGKKFYIPFTNPEIIILSLFILCTIVSTLWNFTEIKDYYFKYTTGTERFFRQMISLVISSVVFLLLFINICYDYGIKRFFLIIRKLLLISLGIVFLVGALEFVIINFNLSALEPIIYIADYFPFTNITLDYRLKRVASLTYEPPALGTYLITVSGFMFSYIFTSKSKLIKYIPILLVVFLALVSKSRTALVVISLQVIIGACFAFKAHKSFRKITQILISFLILTGVFIGAFYYKEVANLAEKKIEQLSITEFKYDENNSSISNKSRLGIQYASWQVFKANPVFGVGWGQQAFLGRKHYPKWAVKNNYEFPQIYLNQRDKSFPPGYNIYIRILTETGIIGFFVFVWLLLSIFYSLFVLYKNNKEMFFLVVALIIGFVGFALNWLQTDSVRIYGFWLCLAFLVVLKKSNGQQTTHHTHSALQ